MRDSFEKIFVHHASATLKGYKSGSLFTYRPSDYEDFNVVLSSLDRTFSGKGVRICIIDKNKGAKQIFVYRPKMIESMLSESEFRSFLFGLGYPVDEGYEANISHLLKKMEENNNFPHELGLFLGYPFDDVMGFIANKGKDYAFCGFWKVYSQPESARERFDLLKKCREHCLECLRQGESVLQLIYAD